MPQECRDSLLLSPAKRIAFILSPSPHPQPAEGRDSLGVRVWIWGGPRGCSTSSQLVGLERRFPRRSGGLIRQQVFLLETPGMTGQLEGQEVVNLTYLFIRGEGHASPLASLPCAQPCLPPSEGPK